MSEEEKSEGKRGAIRHYKDLLVYQQAYRVAPEVSRLTQGFPRHEQYELARQMRAAARSIPANIAEGWARRESAAQFRRFLQMAIGSCEEMKVWLDFSRDEGLSNGKGLTALESEYARIGTLLQRLWKGWRKL